MSFLGDKKAEEAMEQALVDVNKKIAHKLKTKTIHKRTDELNQQALVQAVWTTIHFQSNVEIFQYTDEYKYYTSYHRHSMVPLVALTLGYMHRSAGVFYTSSSVILNSLR